MVPVSAEFVELCEAQVEVLAGSLGASLCIVYLTDDPSGEQASHLIPVVARPDDAAEWVESKLLSEVDPFYTSDRSVMSLPSGAIALSPVVDASPPLPPDSEISLNDSPLGTDTTTTTTASDEPSIEPSTPWPSQARSSQISRLDVESADLESVDELTLEASQPPGRSAIAPLAEPEPSSEESHQIALPLVYQGVMVGLLVTGRPDRFWNAEEQLQIEQIAKTITAACVMDQRSRWLETRLKEQQFAQAQAWHQQHDVFDDLIHQFRNPLTALKTFGKLLLRRLQTGDRNRDVAESIIRESDRLQELLHQFKIALDHDTLLLPSSRDPIDDHGEQGHEIQRVPTSTGESQSVASSKLEPWQSGGLSAVEADPTAGRHPAEPPIIDVSPGVSYITGHEIRRVPCSFVEVLAPILDVAQAIAQDREIDLQTILPTHLPPVLADPRGLQEVVSNLVDNALKYTESGGHVLVQLGLRYGGQQALVIADTGPGIPLEDRTHLFERHYRGVQADGDIPGTGLGLAIAHDLLAQMGGEIEIISPVSEADFMAGWAWITPDHPGTACIIWLDEASNES